MAEEEFQCKPSKSSILYWGSTSGHCPAPATTVTKVLQGTPALVVRLQHRHWASVPGGGTMGALHGMFYHQAAVRIVGVGRGQTGQQFPVRVG